MAFSSASNCKLSDLGLIAAGSGNQTGGSTTATSLRADCANSGSATNVKMWASFAPNARDMTFSPVPTSNAFTFAVECTSNHDFVDHLQQAIIYRSVDARPEG